MSGYWGQGCDLCVCICVAGCYWYSVESHSVTQTPAPAAVCRCCGGEIETEKERERERERERRVEWLEPWRPKGRRRRRGWYFGTLAAWHRPNPGPVWGRTDSTSDPTNYNVPALLPSCRCHVKCEHAKPAALLKNPDRHGVIQLAPVQQAEMSAQALKDVY